MKIFVTFVMAVLLTACGAPKAPLIKSDIYGEKEKFIVKIPTFNGKNKVDDEEFLFKNIVLDRFNKYDRSEFIRDKLAWRYKGGELNIMRLRCSTTLDECNDLKTEINISGKVTLNQEDGISSFLIESSKRDYVAEYGVFGDRPRHDIDYTYQDFIKNFSNTKYDYFLEYEKDYSAERLFNVFALEFDKTYKGSLARREKTDLLPIATMLIITVSFSI